MTQGKNELFTSTNPNPNLNSSRCLVCVSSLSPSNTGGRPRNQFPSSPFPPCIPSPIAAPPDISRHFAPNLLPRPANGRAATKPARLMAIATPGAARFAVPRRKHAKYPWPAPTLRHAVGAKVCERVTVVLRKDSRSVEKIHVPPPPSIFVLTCMVACTTHMVDMFRTPPLPGNDRLQLPFAPSTLPVLSARMVFDMHFVMLPYSSFNIYFFLSMPAVS